MRLFVGIFLSQTLQNLIKSSVHPISLKETKWLLPFQWHITLIPPFDMPTAGLPTCIKNLRERLSDNLAPKCSFEAFDILEKNEHPSLLWLLGRANPDLQAIRNTLQAYPLNQDQRDFKPHVTLARFRRPYAPIPPLEVAPIHHTEAISEIWLTQSTQTPTGSIYTPKEAHIKYIN